MRIGELASSAGTTTRALRYYEAQGLLDAPRRTNGYREYDESHLKVVKEIQNGRVSSRANPTSRRFCVARLTAVKEALQTKLEIAEERAGTLDIVQLNYDDHPAVGQRYGVLGLPTMLLFRDGEPVRSFVGAKPKARLLAELDEALRA